jgi:hypothetical protein
MGTKLDYGHALRSLYDGTEAVWILRGTDNLDGLEWSGPVARPTKAALDAEIVRLQAEWDSTEYQRQRQPEYPPLVDLADALYWQSQGDDSKMSAYLAAVEAVKLKYPKGNS